MGNRSRCNCVTSTCSWLSSPFKQVMILYHAGPWDSMTREQCGRKLLKSQWVYEFMSLWWFMTYDLRDCLWWFIWFFYMFSHMAVACQVDQYGCAAARPSWQPLGVCHGIFAGHGHRRQRTQSHSAMTRKTVRISDILIYFVYVEWNQFLNSVRFETKTTSKNPTNGGDSALLPLTPELELAEIRNELTIWPGRCFVIPAFNWRPLIFSGLK